MGTFAQVWSNARVPVALGVRNEHSMLPLQLFYRLRTLAECQWP